MAIPENPITRQEMYLDAIARKNGGGSADNRFVVTLTPNEDYTGGTSDKTTVEMREAFNQNKQIWFAFTDPDGGQILMPLGAVVDNYGFSAFYYNETGILTIDFPEGEGSTFEMSIIPLGS